MDLQLFARNAVVVLPIYLIVMFCLHRRSKKNGLRIGHKVLAVVFCACMLAVAILTGVTPLSGFHWKINLGDINWNLVQAIKEMAAERNIYGFINLAGNIVMFVPFGFFLPVLSRRNRHVWKVALYGCLFSVCIEAWQLFLLRGTDIMDVFLNTIGAVVGYLIFIAAHRLMPKFTDGFSVKSRNHSLRKLEQKEIAVAIFLPFIVTIVLGFIDAFRYGLYLYW